MMTESTRAQLVSRVRVDTLAAEVEEITGDLQHLVQGSSEGQWQRTTGSEQWPVGVVAHHMTEVAEFFTQVIAAAADGRPSDAALPADDIDQNNARHAAEFATVGSAEVLDAMHRRFPPLVAQIRQLDDSRLDLAAGEFGGYRLTIGQVVELGVIGHFREHLASVRAAMAEAGPHPG